MASCSKREVMRSPRKFRHWKQKFDKNARMVWARPIKFNGVLWEAGTEIPQQLKDNKGKLSRFWESRIIQLLDFESPDVTTGQIPNVLKVKYFDDIEIPKEINVQKLKNGWFRVKSKIRKRGVKVQGLEKLKDAVQAMEEELLKEFEVA